MAHSTKQLLKLDQGQQIRQALSVLEAVVECGIAGICRDRCLFPDSFFTSRDTGSRTRVTQFDMEALREASSMSLSESPKEKPASCHHRSESESSSKDSSGKTDSDTFGVNESTNNNKSSSPNLQSKGDHKNDPSSPYRDHCLSPLTSSACGETPSLKSFHSPEKDHANRSGDDYNSQHSLLGAEALLLIYWVRQGVIQIMREGKLARLVFGVCKRGDSEGGEKCREKVHVAGIKDHIIESYAFDISKLSKTSSGRINQTKVHNAFDALFRNLQSLLQSTTAAVAATPSMHPDVLPSCFSVASISTPKNPLTLQLPKQRYFIIRVEFTQSHSTLPQALNPWSSALNKLAYIDEDKQKETIEPSIVKTLDSQVPTSLGQVVEKNATGLGVRLTAYCEIEDYNDNSTQDDFEVLEKKKRRRIENNNLIIDHKHFHKRRLPMSTAKLDHIMQDRELIDLHSRCFAIPHLPKGRSLADERATKYLACKILDSRTTKKGLVDYKVQFSDQELINAKMKKQWVSCKRVMSEQLKMKSCSSLEHIACREDLENKVDGDQLVIADMLPSLQRSREWKAGSEIFDKTSDLRDTYVCALGKQKGGDTTLYSSNMTTNRRFSFIINPITTVIY